jgi:ADP-heptose:LPS heptosyltransferase/predicted SAM-dependent methyltransferase
MWTIDGPQGNESSKIKWELVPYTRGKGLDLGAGMFKTFPHFISVDNGNHAQFGWKIKPDIFVPTCEKLDLFASQSMDFVFSSHLLEHIVNTAAALKEWWRVIKPGGYLCLYLPHKDFYPNIGEHGSNPDHKHDFLPQDIIDAMGKMKAWDLVENQERNEDNEYSFFQVYKKIGGERNQFSYKKAKPEKTAAVIRYGAFGDLMQASSVFAGLKKQGYHVTLYGTPPAVDVVKHDPNLDQIILQDKDQVPNEELPKFWDSVSKKYDKFVNLSESVEGSLLALPGRAPHLWPKNLRHSVMNRNYLEFQHAIAEIPHAPNVRFHPSEEELKEAKKERAKMSDFVVLWSLAGSSVHKTWPYLDTIIARLMVGYPNVTVVLVGGPECVILEQGWENEARVVCTSGKWSIRQSLTFLSFADLVIGPETGVLNAAANMEVPKIVTLSHSSHENLTRDWKNVTALEAKNTSCYPCHQLHFGWKHCKQDEETGTAACQADISAEAMWSAVTNVIDKAMQKAA